VVVALGEGMGGACELRRARSGRLECWHHTEGGAADEGGKLVALFA